MCLASEHVLNIIGSAHTTSSFYLRGSGAGVIPLKSGRRVHLLGSLLTAALHGLGEQNSLSSFIPY